MKSKANHNFADDLINAKYTLGQLDYKVRQAAIEFCEWKTDRLEQTIIDSLKTVGITAKTTHKSVSTRKPVCGNISLKIDDKLSLKIETKPQFIQPHISITEVFGTAKYKTIKHLKNLNNEVIAFLNEFSTEFKTPPNVVEYHIHKISKLYNVTHKYPHTYNDSVIIINDPTMIIVTITPVAKQIIALNKNIVNPNKSCHQIADELDPYTISNIDTVKIIKDKTTNDPFAIGPSTIDMTKIIKYTTPLLGGSILPHIRGMNAINDDATIRCSCSYYSKQNKKFFDFAYETHISGNNLVFNIGGHSEHVFIPISSEDRKFVDEKITKYLSFLNIEDL